MLKEYLKEFKQLRFFIILLSLVILISYSIYAFLDKNLIIRITSEDSLFEWLTAISLLTASILFIIASSLKNVSLLILSAVFFFGAGEEISWGQRLFNYETPKYMDEINVQGEFTLHNIEVFNTKNFDLSHKEGIHRLLEFNFLFRLFSGVYGIFFPLCVFHFSWFHKVTRKLKIPIPPLSIGLFFLLAWFSYKFILDIVPIGYEDTAGEIFEFLMSFIYLVLSIYFLRIRRENIYGIDIKQFLFSKKSI